MKYSDIRNNEDILKYLGEIKAQYFRASIDISPYHNYLKQLLHLTFTIDGVRTGGLQMYATIFNPFGGNVDSFVTHIKNTWIQKFDSGNLYSTSEIQNEINNTNQQMQNFGAWQFFSLVDTINPFNQQVATPIEIINASNEAKITLENLTTENEKAQTSIGNIIGESIGKFFNEQADEYQTRKGDFRKWREDTMKIIFWEVGITLGLMFIPVIGKFGYTITPESSLLKLFDDLSSVYNIFHYLAIPAGILITLTYLVAHFYTKNYFLYQSLEEANRQKGLIGYTYLGIIESNKGVIDASGRLEITKELTRSLFAPIGSQNTGDSDFVTPITEAIKSIKS